MWLAIVITALCCLLVLIFTTEDPPPKWGVYQQPGKWYHFKYAIFRLLYFKKQLENQRQKTYKPELRSPEVLDKPQKLSEHEKAFDAVFFVAANKEGFYMATGTERRQHGRVNALCYLKVPGVGLLCSDQLPNTDLSASGSPEDYAAGGVSFQMLKPMRKWKVRYNGNMFLHGDRSKVFSVQLDADWISEFPYFDFETDMHPSAVARAFATEKWNRKYFQTLKDAHQSHYEQMGHLKGSLIIDGTQKSILAQAFRDHSFGMKRDWELMHRYAFHIVFFQDGSCLVVAVISQPCTSSRLEVGYTCSPNGELAPVEWCNLELYRHGEGGSPPVDYAFKYCAGGIERVLEVKVEDSAEHRVHEAHMFERFVKVWDDGLPGWGVSEWHYHHKLIPQKSQIKFG